jgi:hypothetical protein
MSTPDLRCQRNARLMLEMASEECNEMHHDLYDDSILPDKDSIYCSSEEMRRFAEKINNFADRLMVEYNKMDHHQYMIELDDLKSESYAH